VPTSPRCGEEGAASDSGPAGLGRAAIWWPTAKLADELDWPTALAGRELEDLTAHGVVERESGAGGAKTWCLVDAARAALVPDGLVGVADPGAIDTAPEREPPACSICGFACDPDLNPHPGCVSTGGAF